MTLSSSELVTADVVPAGRAHAGVLIIVGLVVLVLVSAGVGLVAQRT